MLSDAPRSAPPSSAPSPGGWAAFSVVSVGTLMGALDGNIVNVALPTLGAQFGAGVHRLQWVVNAYVIAITVTLVPLGRLGDRLGHRTLYTAGIVVFTLGSALCGLAPGVDALTASRVLQAMGASAMMAIAPAIVTASFPPRMRGRALGALGTVVALGLTVGSPLGGLILAHLSWRWAFYVSVPVGVAGAAWALRALPGGAGGAGGPLLDGSIFRIPDFSRGLVAGYLAYVAMFTQTFLTPFLLAQVLGLGPAKLGLVLMSVPLALSVASPASGWIADRSGARALTVVGMLTLAAALLALSLVGPDSHVATVSGLLGLAGAGLGIFQAPNNAEMMSALPRERLGSGGGLRATARNAGMASGVALAGALVGMRAGAATHGAAFLAGYGLALRAGAAVALLAAVAPAAPARPGRR